jgi:hypothetical protein
VNRGDQAQALRQHGADIVVSDLAELLPSGTEMEPSSVPLAR